MFGFWIKFRSLPLVAKIWDVIQTLLYGAGWFLVISYMGLPYGEQREMVYMLLAAACGLGMVTTFVMDDFIDAGKEMLVLGLMPVLDRVWIWFDPSAKIALIYLIGFSILFFENLRQFGFWTWLFKAGADFLKAKPKVPQLVIRKGGQNVVAPDYVEGNEEEYYADQMDRQLVENEESSSA